MQTVNSPDIEEAKKAALEVLLHNAHGPFHGLPRTAGWGYPEPYTRDLDVFHSRNCSFRKIRKLLASIRNVLETLAKNQTERGHIPSLVHDNDDRGASDTTPLFLVGVGVSSGKCQEKTGFSVMKPLKKRWFGWHIKARPIVTWWLSNLPAIGAMNNG